MAARLRADGVELVAAIGAGAKVGLPGFVFVESKGDPIVREHTCNVHGATKLCDPTIAEDYAMLVSLGAGFSYRLMCNARVWTEFLGNPSGGASFQLKVRQNQAVHEWVQQVIPLGNSLHIRMGEISRKAREDGTGMYPAAYFARATPHSSPADIAYSYLEELAGQIILDTMLRIQLSRLQVQNVVIIGGVLVHYPALRPFLELGFASVGLKAHFPDRPEFVGAYGAWLLYNEGRNKE